MSDTFQEIIKSRSFVTGSPSGGEIGEGLTESEANGLYFQQSELLSEVSEGDQNTALSNLGLTATKLELNRLDGDLPTVRSNLGLGTGDNVSFSNGVFSGTIEVDGNATLNADLDIGQDVDVTRDGTIGRNLFVSGGLFASEFVVNQTRVRFNESMSVGGGKIASVTGSQGGEVITFEDEDGNTIVPVESNDILRIQRTTGFFGGAIVKSIFRKVSGISSGEVFLNTIDINWATGDDIGSIEVGDNVIVHGNISESDRNHRIDFDISGVDTPRVRVWDNVGDTDTGDVVLQWGGLEGWGSQTGIGFAAGDSSLSGNHILLSDNVASLRFPEFSIINGNATFSGELSAATGSLGTLEVDGTLTIGAGGEISNSGSDYFINDDGIRVAGSTSSQGLQDPARSLRVGGDNSGAEPARIWVDGFAQGVNDLIIDGANRMIVDIPLETGDTTEFNDYVDIPFLGSEPPSPGDGHVRIYAYNDGVGAQPDKLWAKFGNGSKTVLADTNL